ncbi:MAG: hypothetical protein ACXWE9_05195 [Methylobacter sp.]
MRKLAAGFILIMILPMTGHAQAPSAGPVDTQSEAFNLCMRATQRFEQQEKAKGKKSSDAPISASCKTELKPAAYWLCMDKEAGQDVDFNTAHWRCAKQTNILK